MAEATELMKVDNICNRVYVIRGQQVMLDYDLAEIYGYEVKRLNEQVKRNIKRFPEDFMFQLTTDEIPEDFLKSQFATSSWGGKRKLPYAFTEQGIYMLATVLRGGLAEQQSIFIMRAFREMRHYIKQNQQFVTGAEMRLVTAKVSEMSVQMASISERQHKTEQKEQGVEVILFTENGHGRKGFLTSAVVNDFINQYPPLRIKSNPDCHDRWIVLDYGLETEKVYHCGASSKDAGKKLCAINKIENTVMIHPVIDKLLVGEDKFLC